MSTYSLLYVHTQATFSNRTLKLLTQNHDIPHIINKLKL